MSKNGNNEYGVSFGRIMFLQKILEGHSNVEILDRHDDIAFEIRRLKQGDNIQVVCVDPYTASLELVMRIVREFPGVNVIFVGGKWAGYTQDAYDYCQSRNIGIYNAGELAGGLHRDSYWSYEKFDSDGNSEKSIHA